MQLLFERSLGRVTRNAWDARRAASSRSRGRRRCRTWAGTTSQPANDHSLASALPAVCYFAHSYAVSPADRSVVVAETEVGGRSVPSVIADGRVAGVQFHPEKSGPAGRALLQEWLRDAA